MNTLGVERERFIVNDKKEIVSEIGILLPKVKALACLSSIDVDRFTYELFAGQIEDRTAVCNSLKELKKSLLENDQILKQAALELGLSYACLEYVDGSKLNDLRVNPFNRRHQEIVSRISKEQMIAASQVAAIHVHVGVNQEEALEALNSDRNRLKELIVLGDHSDGARIRSYQTMAGEQQFPPLFSNFEEVMNYINSKGGEKNVYDLIRYKPSTKTVEFRMFGTTDDVDEIVNYADQCKKLVLKKR